MSLALLPLVALLACDSPPPPPAKPVQITLPTPPARASHARIATELSARPMVALASAPASSSSGPPNGAPGPKTSFGLYILAMTWEPNFCCTHGTKEQCTQMGDSFASNHLSLHGLWPNFTDDEAKAAGTPYPTFCGDYASCAKSNVAACDPDSSTIPAEMSKYGPGYVTDDDFLADHEWPKHGSCTGLDSGTYFQAAITQLLSLPGDQGTPAALSQNIGGSVKLADLAASFGQADAVMMSCDSSCNLMQVEICFAHDDNNVPTGLTTCPQGAVNTAYDNSCALNKCDTVNIQAAGVCPTSGGGSSPGTCNPDHGQGPACTSDATCTADGYLRCASSGCCTTIPK